MRISKELLKGSTDLVVLSLLGGEDMYGYQMIKEIELRTNGVIALKEGTLYPILHTLETRQAVESYWVDLPSGRRRKYYRITVSGRQRLQVIRDEWLQYRYAVDHIIGEGIIWN